MWVKDPWHVQQKRRDDHSLPHDRKLLDVCCSFQFERASFVRSRGLNSYSSEHGQVSVISLLLSLSSFGFLSSFLTKVFVDILPSSSDCGFLQQSESRIVLCIITTAGFLRSEFQRRCDTWEERAKCLMILCVRFLLETLDTPLICSVQEKEERMFHRSVAIWNLIDWTNASHCTRKYAVGIVMVRRSSRDFWCGTIGNGVGQTKFERIGQSWDRLGSVLRKLTDGFGFTRNVFSLRLGIGIENKRVSPRRLIVLFPRVHWFSVRFDCSGGYGCDTSEVGVNSSHRHSVSMEKNFSRIRTTCGCSEILLGQSRFLRGYYVRFTSSHAWLTMDDSSVRISTMYTVMIIDEWSGV